MKKLLHIIFFLISLKSFGQASNFSYNVAGNVNTSAGVWKNGLLIRTIWSVKPETPGTKIGWWDGNDDFGNPTTADSIQVLFSNVSYNWQGKVGNSAVNQTGYNSFSYQFADAGSYYTAVVVGSTIYYPGGYGEGTPSEMKTTTTSLNYRLSFVGPKMGCNLEFGASDGTNLYISGFDAFSTTHTFVYAHTVPGEAKVPFANGTNYTPVNGAQQSMIAYKSSGLLTSNEITGLAVQQSNPFLIVTRAAINEVQVVNKTSGLTVQTITTITSPGRCAIDGSDHVWIGDATSVKEYSINPSTGALTATGRSIPIGNAGGVAISPNGTKIAVIDMVAEQVKQYTLSGTLVNTLGTGVSYQTDPTVANNKFYYSDTTSTVYISAFVVYLPDSSILVGDRGNGRTQHFASDFSTFIESQTFTSRDYNVAVDNNNSQRVFINMLEYAIDYTKPIGQCWTLVNNWGGKQPFSGNYLQPVTLSNGHTYTMLRGPSFTFYAYELVPGYGLRYCGQNRNFANGYAIDPANGDLIAVVVSGGVITYRRYARTGFDGSNNPVWSGSFTGTGITITGNGPAQSNGFNSNVLKTTAGNWWTFEQQPGDTTGGAPGLKYHLASAKDGTSSWRVLTLPGTSRYTYKGPFPGRGQSYTNGAFFDNGNSVVNAGGVFAISGNNVFMGYHGEFWKSAQTNYYWHFDDSTGLLIGIFGKSWIDYPIYGVASVKTNASVAGATGNALNGTAIIGTDGILYLYHADEVIGDGAHRWSITGLNTVYHQKATWPVAGPGAPSLPGTDLMTGFSRGVINFTNGTSNWTRSIADFNNGNGSLQSLSGFKSYDITKSVDLSVRQNTNVANTDISFTRPMISAGQRSNSWQVTLDANWEFNIPNDHIAPPYLGGSYIELLDSAQKIIAEVHMAGNNGAFEYIVMNGIDIYSDSSLLSVYRTYTWWNTVTFTYVNGNLNLLYNTVNGPASTTVNTPFQAGAVMTQPYTLKLHFFETNAGGFSAVGKEIDVQNVYFNQNYVSPNPSCNCHIRTRGKFTQVISH